MTPDETRPLPMPDPDKLHPDGLSNRTKRWMFLGVLGVVLLIVLANLIGSSPQPSAVKASAALPQQEKNPTPAQIEDYGRNLTRTAQLLDEKTRTDTANLAQLAQQQRSQSQQPTFEDLQKAAALREAAEMRQQGAAAQPSARPAAAPAEKDLGSLVRQERADLSPIPAPWQQQPARNQTLTPTSSLEHTTSVSIPRAPEAVNTQSQREHQRKPLDFDPAQKTFWLPEGTLIEAVLTNRLDGDATGPVNAMVTTDVYLPGTRLLVIPQGARALGESSKVSVLGQQRLAVAFHRILVPGAHEYSIPLDSRPPGLGQTGAVGLHDKVDSHYFQIFGASLAIGAIGGLAQIGNGYTGLGYDPAVTFRNGVTQSTAQSSDRVLDRFLNRLPSITIREGTRIKLLLTDDLEVPVYEGGI